MKFSREQARERTVDYLYGELAGDELRAFEAALRESAELAREVDVLKQTLSLTRETLRMHSEEPPKTSRAAVLTAARAHAASSAQNSRREEPASVRAGRSSFWSFLRTPWLYPAFGVCAAIAFVVVRERREERELAPAAVATEAPEVASSAEQPPAAAAPAPDLLAAQGVASEEAAKREAQAGGTLRTRAGGGAPAKPKGSARVRSAEPFPSEPAGRMASKTGAPAAPTAAPRPARERAEAEGAAPAEPFPGVAVAERAARDRVAHDAADDETRTAATASRGEQRPATGAAAQSAQPAPAKAASARRRADEVAAAPPGEIPSLGAVGSSASEPADAAEAKRAPARADAAGKLATRAAEAQKGGRHQEAIALYRELLARFAGDPRAPVWRRELRRNEQALSAQQRDGRVEEN